jgi:methyl-accepting chemotaxis protein
MLKNTTLRLRLIGAFALILAATATLGLFSVQRLNDVNAAAEDVGTNWLPAANYLGTLAWDFELFRSRQGQTLLLQGEAREKMLNRLAGSQADVEKDLQAYMATVTPGEEQRLAKNMTDALNIYMAQADPYLQLVHSGDVAASTDLYLGTMQPLVDNVRAAIRADRAFQLEKGTEAANNGIALGKHAVQMIWLALLATTLICFAIGFTLIAGISVPIRKMADAMRLLAGGNTDAKIPALGEKNEIGEMAAAVQVFRDNMIRTRELEAETAKAREDAETERKQTMYALADQFETAVGGIVEAVSAAATEMQATAAQLASGAQEASAQATSVSAAAEQAGANVTSVAGSAEELGASVSEISRQVEHSSVKAREAVGEADATAAIVQELSEAAGRITGIVDMITGIASQTNLLALNATIESARAGEAGKGFAVVASEVKQLAGQTSRATADINAQIVAIQDTTRRAVEAIDSITGTIRDINDSSSTIAAAVEQQGAATSEIVQSVAQASVGASEVTANITGVARMAEETGQGAAQVLSASGELSKQAEYLRSQINAFLSEVRAA